LRPRFVDLLSFVRKNRRLPDTVRLFISLTASRARSTINGDDLCPTPKAEGQRVAFVHLASPQSRGRCDTIVQSHRASGRPPLEGYNVNDAMRTVLSCLVLGGALFLVGCDDDVVGGQVDAMVDSGPADSVIPDSSRVDVRGADVRSPDGSPVDLGAVDGTPPDVALPLDVVLPLDVALPPDVALPLDVALPPDVAMPDLAKPDVGVPDLAKPDVGAPDLATPDLATPDLATPDLATPDVGVPDVGVPDVGGPDSGVATACLPSAFGFAAAGAPWPLPGYVTSRSNPFTNSLSRSSSCYSGPANDYPGYRVFDIDGDALPDVVMSSDCNDPTVGHTRWMVYKNTGAGFAAAPTPWPLPGYVTSRSNPFTNSLSRSSSCYSGPANDYPGYRVFDIDGDKRPDVVMSSDCNDATVGHTVWMVYKNTGAGFAAAPTPWALPGYVTSRSNPFTNSLSRSSSCYSGPANDYPGYRVFDIDGDARPEVVMSSDCNDATVGHTVWMVYKNTGAGFAAAPTPWALPAYATSRTNPFTNSLSRSSSCYSGPANDYPGYRVFDIDGDARPEVVMSSDCNDATVGHTVWMVYTNTGAGFAAAPTAWSLPGYATSRSNPFTNSLSRSSSCYSGPANDYPGYRVFDIDGDARPDVVMSSDCNDTAVGQTVWAVYRNTGSGFTAAASCWALPGYITSRSNPFTNSLSRSSSCYSGPANDYPGYRVFDLDGDTRPDVVMSSDCNDATVGHTRWIRYKNGG
jgi:hypothetical protein